MAEQLSSRVPDWIEARFQANGLGSLLDQGLSHAAHEAETDKHCPDGWTQEAWDEAYFVGSHQD